MPLTLAGFPGRVPPLSATPRAFLFLHNGVDLLVAARVAYRTLRSILTKVQIHRA
jgi:hypothetical protein